MDEIWQPLADELDQWHARGRRATLWWRDDDACRNSPELQRLLGIARDHRVPIAVAAIPAASDRSLVEAIERCAEATIVQHGYAHANHARVGERSTELGTERPLAARTTELARGHAALSKLFAARFAPVLVPPWNRIGADLVAVLPSASLHGVSCFGPRPRAIAAPRVVQANTHVDLIAWRRGRRFIGAGAAVDRLVAHLRARRVGEVDADEPTGILTHHLAFDADAFAFMADVCARLCTHRSAAWVDARTVFDAPEVSVI